MRNLVVLFVLTLSFGIAKAGVVVSMAQGELISNPAVTAPGTQFELDFTLILDEYEPPYIIWDIILAFDISPAFESLNITLGNNTTVYSFEPVLPDLTAISLVLYDPAFSTPTGNMPMMEMPAGWKNELQDGILSGRFWIEGAGQTQQAQLLAQASYFVPEPASITLLGCAGSLWLIRRNRNRHK
ncbi:MAG: PEP-CTERM sorting domain-containing protein [Anaerohalosphaera sp.]|nr:PEP-CTERM sorting domain-containing protein [Anaerohalosphaera sp.]